MKRIILIMSLAAMTSVNVIDSYAQGNNGREARRQEMQARMTERLVKDLKLTDEQKAKFDPIYANYQKELSELRSQNRPEENVEGSKKELSDAEATAKLQEVFTRQEQQVQQSQMRLDIQKKYCAELSAILTPQQLLKVFQPAQTRNRQDAQGGRSGRGGQGGGPRGGFGGPGGGFRSPDGGF